MEGAGTHSRRSAKEQTAALPPRKNDCWEGGLELSHLLRYMHMCAHICTFPSIHTYQYTNSTRVIDPQHV